MRLVAANRLSLSLASFETKNTFVAVVVNVMMG